MPPKRKATSRKRKEATDSEDEVPKSKRPCPNPRGKKKGAYKMPEPLPAGEVLTDILKHRWQLAESVGKGGFGEIYRAAPVGNAQEKNYVIKIVSDMKLRMFSLAFTLASAWVFACEDTVGLLSVDYETTE